MIRLTCTLPATADDLGTFLDAARQLGAENIDTDIDAADSTRIALVADLGPERAVTVAPKPPTIVPPVAEKAPPAKKVKTAKKGTAKPGPRKATAPQAGTVALSILTTIVDANGMYDGSYATLARTAYPSNPATAATELGKMERATWIAAERVNNRVQRVAITTKGREVYSRLTDGPAPHNEDEPAPAALAAVPTPPPEGLRPPAGGWA